jgi:hypothetical protein
MPRRAIGDRPTIIALRRRAAVIRCADGVS